MDKISLQCDADFRSVIVAYSMSDLRATLMALNLSNNKPSVLPRLHRFYENKRVRRLTIPKAFVEGLRNSLLSCLASIDRSQSHTDGATDAEMTAIGKLFALASEAKQYNSQIYLFKLK